MAARSRLQGCAYGDPDHTWAGIAVQYADGRRDGFLQTAKVGDRFPIGYYREDDLPILSALAKGYTTFDNYFCSMMGPTWENRLYQITGTTQLDEGWCDFPKEGEASTCPHSDRDLRPRARCWSYCGILLPRVTGDWPLRQPAI